MFMYLNLHQRDCIDKMVSNLVLSAKKWLLYCLLVRVTFYYFNFLKLQMAITFGIVLFSMISVHNK